MNFLHLENQARIWFISAYQCIFLNFQCILLTTYFPYIPQQTNTYSGSKIVTLDQWIYRVSNSTHMFKFNNENATRREDVCIPENIYLFKVNNRNTRRKYEICSTFKRHHSSVSIVYLIGTGANEFPLVWVFIRSVYNRRI